MDKDTQEILVAGGALLLPFLFKKDKKNDNKSLNDLSRFDNYPNGSGEFGGGYYDKQTQERLQEQAKKASPLYFGDKSKNAIYDPFYDFNDSPIQAQTINARDLSATDYDKAAKCVRVRIVPNSLYVSNTFSRETFGDHELKENHLYACVVEIFNPFPFVGLDSPKFKIDIDNITLSDKKMAVYDGNGNKHELRYYYETGAIYNTISDGIDKGIYEFYKKNTDNEGVYYNMPQSVPGLTSVYMPVFLSFLPFKSGNITRTWYMLDEIDFYKYNISHNETVGVNPTTITGLEFTVLLKINGSIRDNVVSATMGKNSYSFETDRSVSASHQNKEYFEVDSYPVFSRGDFWAALFGQRELDLSTETGGAAARSYWWNYSRLRAVEQFAPFGYININF